MSDPFKDDDRRGGPSKARLTIWIIVAAIGLWLVGSGVWGLITPG
jgi:nitric oxide reductase large subunit